MISIKTITLGHRLIGSKSYKINPTSLGPLKTISTSQMFKNLIN